MVRLTTDHRESCVFFAILASPNQTNPLGLPVTDDGVAGVGVGFVGTALSKASINSAIDHTRSVIPSAIAGVIRKASCVRQRL
jgi:hypothetical protein